MSWQNKIVWTEGLFLGPQHFQQQERYLEAYAHKRASPLTPFYWGFEKYQIDSESLPLGKVVLSNAVGVFSDGTPFDAPAQTPPPPPLTVRAEHLEQIIYLAAPIRTPNAEETTFDESVASLARYVAAEEELRDSNAIGQGPKLVQLAQLRLRLLPGKELTDAWLGLPIARVSSLHSDGSISLDQHLIPPVANYGASPLLTEWITHIHGLTQLRAQALSARLTGAEGKAEGAAEVADFMLLQTFNRYEPLLTHWLNVKESHPEGIYQMLSSYASELSTFITRTRRPKECPAYRHLDPYHSFRELVDTLLTMLNEVLIRSAERIELQERQNGVRLAIVDAPTLQSFSGLVLAVSATIPPDELAQRFPLQSKFGPSDHLPKLVRSHLPGISISALPVPPRQIPFSTGFVYYELSRVGPMWDDVLKRGGLSMYIAEVFPDLNIELWGIRNK
jgi:type VI secretion system protein ImpJ